MTINTSCTYLQGARKNEASKRATPHPHKQGNANPNPAPSTGIGVGGQLGDRVRRLVAMDRNGGAESVITRLHNMVEDLVPDTINKKPVVTYVFFSC